MENKINDYQHYTTEMKKSLMDKIFFVDKLPENVDLFVDYGCADGNVIKLLNELFPHHSYIGYDNNTEMLEMARKNLSEGNSNNEIPSNVIFTDNWKFVEEIVRKNNSGNKSCLILNSVIHEVLNYSKNKYYLGKFWNMVFDPTLFNYIVIRDMMPSKTINRPALDIDHEMVRKAANPKQLNDFEKVFGSIDNQQQMVHFLLKHRYVQNWNRECAENYFPVYQEEFLDKVGRKQSAHILYSESFQVPFLMNEILNFCGVTFLDKTHAKFIIENKMPS